MEYGYRFATTADVETLVTSDGFATYLPIWGEAVSYDADGVRAFITDILTSQCGNVMLVTCGSEIVGCMILQTFKFPYFKETVLQNVVFSVAEAHRSSRIALNLLNWAKHIATESKMPLMFTQTSGFNPTLIQRLVTGAGFTLIGTNALYVPK